MPSAANVKIDKHQQQQQQQIAGEASANPTNATVVVQDPANSSNPLRQAITTIEHKIRNLEKRKAKLVQYKELQSTGKELNQDQKTAIAKFDEVVQTLDFARDLCKQFIALAMVSEKEAKKQARKDALAKSQSELAKVREVLLVQDALTQMGQENIRDDFLHGRNGAAQLSENDLKLLDDLYTNVTPKHEPGDSQVFCTQIQGAAEHLLAVVDGKPKEIFGSTYGHIKDIIGKIHESGYFDQSQQEQFVEVVDVEVEEGVEPNPTPSSDIINHEMIESIDSITIEARPPPPPAPVVQSLTPVQPPQPVEQPPMVPVIPADQQPIYYAAAPQHQPPQQPQQPPPRPLSDVLGSGSFTFLQDSELDTPPEQIPSQTFTNQSYVQGPPPPIPMPPHFQPYPQPIPPQQQQPPQQQPPQQQQQQQQQPPPPQQLSPSVPQQTNNLDESNHHDHQMNDVQKQRGGRPRGVGGGNQQQQPFYANNNGYSNRQRQNRNGPGPRSSNNNNRHNQ